MSPNGLSRNSQNTPSSNNVCVVGRERWNDAVFPLIYLKNAADTAKRDIAPERLKIKKMKLKSRFTVAKHKPKESIGHTMCLGPALLADFKAVCAFMFNSDTDDDMDWADAKLIKSMAAVSERSDEVDALICITFGGATCQNENICLK